MSYGVRSLATGLAVVLSAAVVHAEPSASDRATARVLADEAGEALDQKNYEVAADKFGRAEALVHAPTLLLGLARAEVGLHKFVEANENYQRILREGVAPGSPPSFAKALQDAQREMKAITPKLAWVTVTLKEPPTSVVTVDGVELPKAAMDVKRAVNPGSHVLKGTADGYNPTTTTIEVKEGESKAVTLALDPLSGSAQPATATPPPASDVDVTAPAPSADASDASGASRQRTFGFIGLGVGAAGLVVGGVAGLVAIGRHNTLESDCPNGKCPPNGQTTIDSFRSMATISTVGFVVGALAAAGGGALLLTAPRPAQTGSVQPFVGFGSVGARVTF
jgi:PEGA domain